MYVAGLVLQYTHSPNRRVGFPSAHRSKRSLLGSYLAHIRVTSLFHHSFIVKGKSAPEITIFCVVSVLNARGIDLATREGNESNGSELMLALKVC